MRYIYTWCLVYLVSLSAVAQQNGIISGKVLDGSTHFSLPGATLRLDAYNRYTISTQTGDYEFLGVPAGIYEVTISYLGYGSQTSEVTVTAGGNAVVNFELKGGGY